MSKNCRNYSRSAVTRQSTTTSVRTYGRNNCSTVPRYRNGSGLKGATAHVLRSNNPRTQATGVALGAFAAIGAVAAIAVTALDIIGGGNGRR